MLEQSLDLWYFEPDLGIHTMRVVLGVDAPGVAGQLSLAGDDIA